jgi:hypothetical protein
MTAVLIPPIVFQGWTPSGKPLVGGKLNTYVAGTSLPQATYTDESQTIPNTNPVILNSQGQAAVWLDPALTYKFVLTDSQNNPIDQADQVQGAITANALTQQFIGKIIYPITPAERAAGVTPINFAYPEGYVQRYGWIDDNITDNGPLVQILENLAQSGIPIYWKIYGSGIYKTSIPFLFTVPVTMIGTPGVRIKLTASSPYVVRWQCAISHGGLMSDFILDGGGFAADGLYLSQVVSAEFPRLRVTNVTNSGLHLAWAQLCYFDTYTCSNNVEPMSSVPNYGVLLDNALGLGVPSSANTFINPTIEQLSASSLGIGVNAKWAINNVFLNGTNEGNKIGYIFGNASVGDNAAQGNLVIGGDSEVNSVADLQFIGTNSFGNNTYAVSMISTASVSFSAGTAANRIFGGFAGGITLDSTAQHNVIDSVTLIGAGATIADSGSNNVIRNVWNVSTSVSTADYPARRRGNFVLAATGAIAIDCALVALATINYIAAGSSTISISAPTNVRDSMELDIALHVGGAGAITLAWDPIFKMPAGGVTVPANGFNRTYKFRFDVNLGFWYLVSQTAADVAN